jgi:SRSO17 transposase
MGLPLAGEGKSVEPMAARLCPDNLRQTHQSLHHVVADAPWSDEDLLEQVRRYVLPALQKQGPVVAWVVEDTGFVKKGTPSVGVTRQYCGQVGKQEMGKQENCRIGVSLWLRTANASLPIGWRLYLPEIWTEDKQRRKGAGIPAEIEFRTQPEIACEQIRAAVDRQIPSGPLLADAAYGHDTKFRESISELGLLYVVGVPSSTTVWKPGQGPMPKRKWKGIGRPTSLLRRDPRHKPIPVRELALSLPLSAWKTGVWREGTRKSLRSRFAAVRIRTAHRDDWSSEPRPEEWLLIEGPRQETEPTKYWLSTLPVETKLSDFVRLAKPRWIIERDYQELKQELGLGHYEGRGSNCSNSPTPNTESVYRTKWMSNAQVFYAARCSLKCSPFR